MIQFPMTVTLTEYEATQICVSLGSHAAEECELLHKVEDGTITIIDKRTVKSMIIDKLKIILALETKAGKPLQTYFPRVQGSIDMVEVR